jgi:hypothetical protein
MYSQLPFTLCLVLLAASQCSDFDYCHPVCVRGWKYAVGSCVPTHKSAVADAASGAIGHRDQAGRAPGPASKRACPASSHIPLDSACPVSFVLIASRWSSASTPALLAAVPGSRSIRHLVRTCCAISDSCMTWSSQRSCASRSDACLTRFARVSREMKSGMLSHMSC